ncbi:hypothetical protein GCM10009753_75840 [Streptantibioticus ferralitis]
MAAVPDAVRDRAADQGHQERAHRDQYRHGVMIPAGTGSRPPGMGRSGGIRAAMATAPIVTRT